MRFRKKPVVVEAIQWTGRNVPEVKAWMTSCLHRDGQSVPDIALFVKRRSSQMTTTLFSNLLDDPKPEVTAALWVAANSRYLGIVDGEWIIKDQHGFYPCLGDDEAPANYDRAEVTDEEWKAYADAVDKDCTSVGFSGEGRCIEPAVDGPLCVQHKAAS